ncbi:aminomethyltransferase family protein, partial [Anoxynatronum buryatiense]
MWEKMVADKIEGKTSPLHDWHMNHGAEMLWDDGYPWTVHQGGDPLLEYEAIRTGAGLLDLFAIFTYEIVGPAAADFIQRTFTNTVAGMKPGDVRYGAFVNHQGMLMDEGNVYRFAEDRFMIMVNAPRAIHQIKSYAEGLDARVIDRTDDYCMIGVQGPESEKILAPLVAGDLSQLKFFHFWPEPTTVAGRRGWVSRTGYSGEKGYEVWVEIKDALHLWEKLVAAGGVPYGVMAVDIARVEAGLLLIYLDFDLGTVSPWDLSLDRFIKLHPDCVGTEALAVYGKNPPKRLKTLVIEGDQVPEHQ